MCLYQHTYQTDIYNNEEVKLINNIVSLLKKMILALIGTPNVVDIMSATKHFLT